MGKKEKNLAEAKEIIESKTARDGLYDAASGANGDKSIQF
jgi:hypothetical protein